MNPPVRRAVPTRRPGRGNLLSALALALSFAAAAIPASAQYPTKPVRIIVPFPAGGTADIMARVVGQKMTETWGQQVLIDNRSGAGGNIAAELAAKSAPDGYTLFLCTVGTHAVHQTLYEKLSFDPIKDFSAVAYIAGVPNVVVVHPSIPVKSVKELIGFIKARPGQINFGSSGTGSSVHMSGEMLKVMAGLDMTHIPYKGNPQAVTDLMAGQIELMITNMPSVIPYIQSGTDDGGSGLAGIRVVGMVRAGKPGGSAARHRQQVECRGDAYCRARGREAESRQPGRVSTCHDTRGVRRFHEGRNRQVGEDRQSLGRARRLIGEQISG